MTRRWLVASVCLLACLACRPGVETDLPPVDLTDAETEVVRAVEAARQAVLDDPDSATAWARLGERYRAGACRRDDWSRGSPS